MPCVSGTEALSAESSDGGVPFEEWQAARDLISNFDQRVHDLRNWGFSFITALLAAQSLLLPSLLPNSSNSNSSAIAEPVKFGVLTVTLVLIVALRQVEKNYQVYQKAANFRALVLESRLNVELGTTITDRYERFHMSYKVTAIYILFVLADAVLGVFVLSDEFYSAMLVAVSILAATWVFQIKRSDVYFARGERSDWTFDRLECVAGETLTITLTNMSEREPIELSAGDAIMAIRRSLPALQVGKGSVPISDVPQFEFIKTPTKVSIEGLRHYSWSWPTRPDMEAGIYEVFPTVDKGYIERMKGNDLSQVKEAASRVGLKGPEKMKAQDLQKYQRWLWPKPLARSITITKKEEQPEASAEPAASRPKK